MPRGATAADPRQVAEAAARRHGARGKPARVETHETHISWVFLAGDSAYKLKKPLVLDFLDYGTAQRRLLMCEEEVRLNRRLAPDVYRGVLALVACDEGLRLAGPTDPPAVDYVVHMRRYDETATLAALLAEGRPVDAELVAVARLLARFHASAGRRPHIGEARRVRAEVERNLWELASVPSPPGVDLGAVDAPARFLRAFVTAYRARLDARGASGRVREGHGDLRAEHVIVHPRLSVVDGVEFDPELRTLDVADDLGFLAMDLAASSAVGGVRGLLDAYREAGGDCGADALVWFYGVHRALVRAKVALVRRGQAPHHPEAQARADAAAIGMIGLADRLTWRARAPLVLAVCGAPGSGKSHLATGLARRGDLPTLSSDLVRKELAGVAAQARAPAAVYSELFSARTYDELGARAATLLDDHGVVIIDATFGQRRHRARLCARLGARAQIVFVECVAPPRIRAERVHVRERHPDRVSDAGAEVAAALAERWQPLDETPGAIHLPLRTDRPVADVIGDLAALLDERIARG